jgi:hypothetical protein
MGPVQPRAKAHQRDASVKNGVTGEMNDGLVAKRSDKAEDLSAENANGTDQRESKRQGDRRSNILSSMTRRLGFASLVVVVLAFAGASAGPARPLHSLRLVVSIAWLNAPDESERDTQPLAARIAQPPAITVSQALYSAAFRSLHVERALFQRPPPTAL